MIRYAAMSGSLVLAWVASACSPVQADLFLLANGGRVEGKLLNPRETPRKVYLVQPIEGGSLTLARSAVAEVVSKSDLLHSYQAALPALADTEAAHLDMAQKCQKAGLTQERNFHMEQVLRHNADNEVARYALGYRRLDGKWQRQDDWMEQQGYIKHRGEYKLPQEIEIERREQKFESQQIEWRKKIKLWRSWVIKGRDRAHEGLTNLRGIRDPMAASSLATNLRQPREPRALKELYLEILSRFTTNGTAIGALTWAGLRERDRELREKALDALAESGSPIAVEAFVKTLQDSDNVMVNRAAVALSHMKQPQRSTLPLIDALVTEHKRVVGGGGMQTTFGGGGAGSLSVGGKPKVEKVKLKNQPVLHALTALHPGVNFGFDQAAWKRWYVSQNTPADVNLRRLP